LDQTSAHLSRRGTQRIQWHLAAKACPPATNTIMRCVLLACDFDGTLTETGVVDEAVTEALTRFTESGRKVVLVTGRCLDEVLTLLPRIELFERIVAENGAVCYNPSRKATHTLGERPPDELGERLEQSGVSPLHIGKVIVATLKPHETEVLRVIRELGLGHQVIFNNRAVMVLPPGVDKGSGLRHVLEELSLSRHNAVAVGDAENDHALLQCCEVAVAVQNALPKLKQRADIVTVGRAGHGIVELIDGILANHTAPSRPSLVRKSVVLGSYFSGGNFEIDANSAGILIVGPSGSGKSRATTALLERITEREYQVCLIDPEGDYDGMDSITTVGSPSTPASIAEAVQLLRNPNVQVGVNLLGITLTDRPPFFADLLGRLQDLRARMGRPHWIVIDEAHHVAPASWAAASVSIPAHLASFVAVTVHPEKVSSAILRMVRLIIAVGPKPRLAFEEFAKAIGISPPGGEISGTATGEDDVVVWSPGAGDPTPVHLKHASFVRRRHSRKYAQGELRPEDSFYFRGPHEKLNLRAHNLQVFLSLAEGVDSATWLYHLRRGDYSRWVRDKIKDPHLAETIGEVESGANHSPSSTFHEIKNAIEERYTLSS
jgi:hydroxymethylpyrimidine pyrophosphatase-like HAD family hydrolase